jgi:hypothetical protein
VNVGTRRAKPLNQKVRLLCIPWGVRAWYLARYDIDTSLHRGYIGTTSAIIDCSIIQPKMSQLNQQKPAFTGFILRYFSTKLNSFFIPSKACNML